MLFGFSLMISECLDFQTESVNTALHVVACKGDLLSTGRATCDESFRTYCTCFEYCMTFSHGAMLYWVHVLLLLELTLVPIDIH